MLRLILSQYEILERLAKYISTIDLFHVGLVCSDLHAYILESHIIFDKLKRLNLCDGRGLAMRQNYAGLYHKRCGELDPLALPAALVGLEDEEIEVRVWNVKCDEVHSLPCLKCGINICEECRFLPRVRDMPEYRARRRPHLDPEYNSHSIICHCMPCDQKLQSTAFQKATGFCECDQYTRWICYFCRLKEENDNEHYYSQRSMPDWKIGPEDQVEDGIWLPDHQFYMAFWCPCGARAPSNAVVRCAWCLKPHDLETWMDEDPDYIPFFDDPIEENNHEPGDVNEY